MSKYEYAYYESERRLIAISDIREESKKNPYIYTHSGMKGIFFAPNASKPGSLLCKEQTSRFFAQLRGLPTETAAILSVPNMCLPPLTLRTLRTKRPSVLSFAALWQKPSNVKSLVLTTRVEAVPLISRMMKDPWHRSCSVAKSPSA